jgi:hypothetical protein
LYGTQILTQNNSGFEIPVASAQTSKTATRPFAAPMIVSPGEVAHYIADIILDLRNMANGDNHKALRDLLELSFYEASYVANRMEMPRKTLEEQVAIADAIAA